MDKLNEEDEDAVIFKLLQRLDNIEEELNNDNSEGVVSKLQGL